MKKKIATIQSRNPRQSPASPIYPPKADPAGVAQDALGSLMFGFISPERQIKQFVAVCLP